MQRTAAGEGAAAQRSSCRTDAASTLQRHESSHKPRPHLVRGLDAQVAGADDDAAQGRPLHALRRVQVAFRVRLASVYIVRGDLWRGRDMRGGCERARQCSARRAAQRGSMHRRGRVAGLAPANSQHTAARAQPLRSLRRSLTTASKRGSRPACSSAGSTRASGALDTSASGDALRCRMSISCSTPARGGGDNEGSAGCGG